MANLRLGMSVFLGRQCARRAEAAGGEGALSANWNMEYAANHIGAAAGQHARRASRPAHFTWT